MALPRAIAAMRVPGSPLHESPRPMAQAATDPAVAALQEDLAALKSDVASLLAHLRQGAGSGAHAVADQIDDKAHRLCRALADESAGSLKAIGARIEEQPLLAVLIAGGIGFCAGRLLFR